MKYVIGIDGSTTKTGLSVFKLNTKGNLIYATHFLFEKKLESYSKKSKMTKKQYNEQKHKNIEIRSLYMAEEILKQLKKYKPILVIMEDTYAQNDIHSLKWLCRLQGLVLSFCLENNCKLLLKTPNQWRTEVGIKTREGKTVYKRPILKQQAIDLVQEIFHINVTDDEADAILIGLSGKEMLRKGFHE